jgi:hypothetical protein
MKMRKTVLPVGGLAALVLLVAWVLNHLSGHGGGSGDASIGTAVAPAAPAQATQTMQVVIQDDRYLVSGKDMTLADIVSAAGAGHADGPAIKIVSGPDSRLGTERELENALDAAHLAWGLEAQPATEP